MSFSIISQPNTIELADNPVKVQLASNGSNYVYMSSRQAHLKLDLTEYMEQDDIIIFSNGLFSVKFTAKNIPDDSGHQVQANNTGLSIKNWLLLFCAGVNKDYLMNKHYIIYSSNESLHILSKLNDAVYTIAYSITGFTYTQDYNLSTIPLIPYTNYKLGAQVQIFDHHDVIDVYRIIGDEAITPVWDGTNAISTFNIASYLKAELASDFEFPHNLNTIVIHRPAMVKKYKLRYWEQSSLPVVRKSVTEIAGLYALNGGVSDFWANYFKIESSSAYLFLKDNQKFLNWHPVSKYVTPDMAEKLYYLCLSTGKTYKLCWDINFTNGTSVHVDATFSCTMYNCYELKVGIKDLGIDDYCTANNLTLQSYSVYVTSDTVACTELRTYIVDDNFYPVQNFFYFKNSLGAYELLRCTGEIEVSGKYDRDRISLLNNMEVLEKFRTEKQGNSKVSEECKANTGWLSRNAGEEYAQYMLDYLQEFFLSDDIFEVINGKLFQVSITSKSIDKSNSSEFNYSCEFVYERSSIAKFTDGEELSDNSIFTNQFSKLFK